VQEIKLIAPLQSCLQRPSFRFFKLEERPGARSSLVPDPDAVGINRFFIHDDFTRISPFVRDE